MEMMTWVGTFFTVSVFAATIKWRNDDTLHNQIKSDKVFASFLIDQRKTYNYYSTLSFTSDKLYDDFGKEASTNFMEMSQKIESMVRVFFFISRAYAIIFSIIFSTLASETSIQLILHIFAKWEEALRERDKTKLTVDDFREYVFQG